ncbi:MAG: hypothetical protein M3388_01560 [Acidobacteriota bacterium]|nr:hypothetical protein [Acidobacteriota bacterium]
MAVKIIIIFLSIFAVGVLGLCEIFGSRSLQNQIGSLFEPHKILVRDLKCETDLRSRSGLCRFSADSEQIKVLVAGLELKGNWSDEERFIYMSKIGKCKKASLSLENIEVRAFRSPVKTPLFDGSAFKFLILFHNPQMNEGCVQIQYG